MPRPTLKKRADGRYRCKYHGQYFYGSTVSEAYAARDAYILQERDQVPEVVTVKAYAEKWLPAHKAGVMDRTYQDYKRIIKTLISELGDVPMTEVTTTDIMEVYAKHYIGKSESAIHKAKMLFTAIWDTALEDRLVTRNPCRSEQARPHRGTTGTHRELSAEEDRLILLTQHSFRLAALVMRYAGLRRGEVLALNIDRDVDFKRKVIHVREAVRYDSNTPLISTTKTSNGIRDVPLFSILENELKGHHGLVAPSAKGTLMSHAAFISAWRSYKRSIETEMNGDSKRWFLRRKADKDTPKDKRPSWQTCDIRVHDLRHSFCTMIRDAGVDTKLAIRWMGHADEKMILKIYDHITEKRIKMAIENVEKDLEGVKMGVKTEELSKKAGAEPLAEQPAPDS